MLIDYTFPNDDDDDDKSRMFHLFHSSLSHVIYFLVQDAAVCKQNLSADFTFFVLSKRGCFSLRYLLFSANAKWSLKKGLGLCRIKLSFSSFICFILGP